MVKINKTKFMRSKEASKILGIHPRTLYLWEEKGIIETIRSNLKNGKRFYNVEKYLKNQGLSCHKIINETEIKCSKIGDLEKEKKK